MNVIVWLLLCVIWGTTWFVIKVGLADLPPFWFAAVRFIVAGLILLAVIRLQKIPLPVARRDWALLAVTGFLQFSFNYSTVFWAEQYISSGLAAVLQATIPAFGLLAARVHLPQESVTWRKITAILLGVVGVATIFVEQLRVDNWTAFAGCVAIVAGAFAAAESNVLTKRFGSSLHPASLVFGQMACGLLPLLLVGFFKEGSPLKFRWTPVAVLAVFYLAVVGTIVAFWLYYWLLKRVESTKAMTIALVTPLVAVFVGAVALDERLLPRTFFGAALILGSVCLTALARRPRPSVEKLGPRPEVGGPAA